MATALGPFGRPVRAVAGAALGLLSRLRRDAETLRQAVIAPAVQGAEIQSARLTELEAEVKALRRAARPARTARGQTA